MSYNFSGYTVLGSVFIGDASMDDDSDYVVAVRDADNVLVYLIASGCSCCTNIYDNADAADFVVVSDLMALATMLYGDVTDSDGEAVVRAVMGAIAVHYGADDAALPAAAPLAIEG